MLDQMIAPTGLPVFGSAARFRFQTMSCAVTDVPSRQKAPLRTSISPLVLSAFQPHLVSRPGLNDASLFWSMNWSKTLFQSACNVGFTDDGPLVGSQLGRATL